jgi:hypothetical protein
LSWPYLLDVLKALGFGQKWRDWVAAILATSSSRVLVNGHPSNKFKHARGLRQGDPLLPMLFILAIDPLQKMIEQAARIGFLRPVLPKSARLRCSLYADDAGIFANPDHMELQILRQLLSIFTNCSGLKFNLAKTEIFPIRCQSATVSSLIHLFPGRISTFPRKYLGLPLHTRKLRPIEVVGTQDQGYPLLQHEDTTPM